jgi:tRNA(adenine34) deaminase
VNESIKNKSSMEKDDSYWMRQALLLANEAERHDEVPVGAIVVLDNQIIGRGYNQPITSHDPTAHAEIVALRDAAKNIENYRLVNATLYVTLEPCTMCAGAIIHSRVKRLVFGASELKAGAIESCGQIFEAPYVNHKVEWLGGVCKQECSEKLSAFFSKRREIKRAEK